MKRPICLKILVMCLFKNMEKTIRELINDVQNELFTSGDMLEPIVASKKAVELSALYSRVVKQLVEKEMMYKRKLEEIHLANKDKSASYAKIRAEATKEFAEWREMDANLRAITEMNRSLKRFQDANKEDYFNQRQI